MTEKTYEWARAEERALARYVRPEALPAVLAWPTYINRLDLLSAKGPRAVAAQLYDLLREQQIQYDLAPFNPKATATQLIRTPATVLKEKRGTCLDLAVLFAALCLENDLLPIIVCLDGHALAGFSLMRTRHSPEKPPKPFAWDKGQLVRLDVLKELAGQEYALVECTGAAGSASLSATFPEGRGREAGGTMSFERAGTAGQEQIAQHARLAGEVAGADRREFLYALDIHDLQVNHGFAPAPEKESGPVSSSRSVFDQRGQTVHGPQTNIAGNVHGPVLSGDFKAPVQVGDIKVGNVSGSGIAIGHGAQAYVTPGSADALAVVVKSLLEKVNALPDGPDKKDATDAVARLETEARKGDQAEENRVRRWFSFLAEAAPDVGEVAVASFLNPIAGVGKVFQLVAARAKEERQKKDKS